jgi:hypothetical protein
LRIAFRGGHSDAPGDKKGVLTMGLRQARRWGAALAVLALMVSVMVAVPVAAAGTVVVDQDNLGVDWFTADTRAGGTVQFVNGPATPPLGTGSVEFTTTDTAGGSGQAKAQLFTYQYGSLGTPGAGLALADITAMSYSAYKSSASTNSNAQTLGLNIEVDHIGDGSGFTTLVFEPVYQAGGVGAIATDAWQVWDAFQGGNAIWWSSQAIPGVCAFSCYVTWNTIVANNPNAEVKFGFGFNVGSGWVGEYSGNGDALALGILGDVTTYDFELTPPAPPGPTPDVPVRTRSRPTRWWARRAVADSRTEHRVQVGTGRHAAGVPG